MAAPPSPLPPLVPPPLQPGGDAFEAFARCSFEEAARLVAEELRVAYQQGEEEETKATHAQGVLLPCPARAEEAPRIAIRLEEECGRQDKLAAILLQCAYELKKREAEEDLFVVHYARQGSIPFPVALIWLQVCLAKGGAHYGTVRQVCTQLLAALVEAAGEGHGEEEGEEQEEERRVQLAAMYGQAMELLVLKVMLPLGEGEAALAQVQADRVLEARLRSNLCDACDTTIKRRRALINGNGGTRARQQGSKVRGRRREDEYPATISSPTSTALTMTRTRYTPSGLSALFSNLWGGSKASARQQLLVPPATAHQPGQSTTDEAMPSPSSTGSHPPSSSPTGALLVPGASSPQQLLLTLLGFLTLAIGFHLRRRGLVLGPRDMARRTMQAVQRVVTFVFFGSGGGGGGV